MVHIILVYTQLIWLNKLVATYQKMMEKLYLKCEEYSTLNMIEERIYTDMITYPETMGLPWIW